MKDALHSAVPRTPVAVALFLAFVVGVAMLPQPPKEWIAGIGCVSIGVLLEIMDDLSRER